MVIDFHTHTFPSAIAAATVAYMSEKSHLTAYTDGSEEGLIASMQAAEITHSVVLPVVTNPEKTRSINDFSARMNGRNGVFHLGGLHPDTPELPQEAARVASLGLRGVKIHPVYQRTPIDDPRFLRVLEAAAENGLFVVIHAGLDVGFPGRTEAAVERIAEALRQTGPVTMVLAHTGGWRQWESAALLAEFPNTYIDCSFSLGRILPTAPGFYSEEEQTLLDAEGFLRVARAFGPRRVLFGTDSPWASQSETLALARALPLTPEDAELFFYKNAAKLLKLEETAL